MERLIKNGDIILDGTLPRCDKEKQALKKLGMIEDMLDKHEIKDCNDLDRRLKTLNLFKKNTTIAIDEDERKPDFPCCVIAMKIGKDKLAIIYSTHKKEGIDLLKGVIG